MNTLKKAQNRSVNLIWQLPMKKGPISPACSLVWPAESSWSAKWMLRIF
jgi:hypothetical protein